MQVNKGNSTFKGIKEGQMWKHRPENRNTFLTTTLEDFKGNQFTQSTPKILETTKSGMTITHFNALNSLLNLRTTQSPQKHN